MRLIHAGPKGQGTPARAVRNPLDCNFYTARAIAPAFLLLAGLTLATVSRAETAPGAGGV